MSFLGEVKRRKVFQVAVVYAVVAWLLVQVITSIEAPLSLPDWVDTLVIVLLAIGFPITLIISWAFNLTAEGIIKDQGQNAAAQRGGKGIEYVLIGLLVIAVGWILYRVEFDESETVVESSVPVEAAVEDVSSEILPGVTLNSIAVLPFDNLSLDPEDAFFAAGIHDSTLNQLAKISGLIVISRTSVMQYEENRPPIPEIAEALNVATVMEGSVRYADGRVLITAQLIDGKTDAHLWSDEFDRELVDVFAIQAEVAKQIATAMRVQLLPDELSRIENRGTESAEAYQHYLHAQSLPNPQIRPEYLPSIIGSLERAIAADPEYAEAYAALAWAYYTGGLEPDLVIEETALKAIELEPTVDGAYSVLGIVYSNYYARQEEASAAYERAVELSPGDPFNLTGYAYYLAKKGGDYTEAIRLGERAMAIDPTNAFAHHRLGFIYMHARDLAAASRNMREAIRLNPGNYLAYLNLGFVEYLSGDSRAAKENLDHAVSIMSPRATYRADYIVYLYGLLGDAEQAAKLLSRLEEIYGEAERPIGRSLDWAVLGIRDKERALREWTMTVDGYLEENEGVPIGRITRFRDNWLNDPMLEEPEFLELRRRLGFKR